MVIKEDDLIKLLGLDVPAAPRVSLAGIKADGAVFHWEPAEPRSGIQAYQIKINGVFGTLPLARRLLKGADRQSS